MQAKLDLVDMEDAFMRSRRMFITLHQEANSVSVSLNQYKEAYSNQESRASTFAKDNDTLKHSLAEQANTSKSLKLEYQNKILEAY